MTRSSLLRMLKGNFKFQASLVFIMYVHHIKIRNICFYYMTEVDGLLSIC